MVSSLKVNFNKSCLIGVNVAPEFTKMAYNFLNCCQDSISFMYFGLPVGVNLRKVETWKRTIKDKASFMRIYIYIYIYIIKNKRRVLMHTVATIQDTMVDK